MKHFTVLAVLLAITTALCAQNGSAAQQLLQKSKDYHDPMGKWATFEATLNLLETRPNGKDRQTQLKIDNIYSPFYLRPAGLSLLPR